MKDFRQRRGAFTAAAPLPPTVPVTTHVSAPHGYHGGAATGDGGDPWSAGGRGSPEDRPFHLTFALHGLKAPLVRHQVPQRRRICTDAMVPRHLLSLFQACPPGGSHLNGQAVASPPTGTVATAQCPRFIVPVDFWERPRYHEYVDVFQKHKKEEG